MKYSYGFSRLFGYDLEVLVPLDQADNAIEILTSEQLI
jgi:hypothetical protein